MARVSFDFNRNSLTVYNGTCLQHVWTVEDVNGEKLFTRTSSDWRTGKVISTEKRRGLSSACSEFNICDYGGEKVEKMAVQCLFLMASA